MPAIGLSGFFLTELSQQVLVRHRDESLGPVVFADGVAADVEFLGIVTKTGLPRRAEPGRIGILGGGIDAGSVLI